MISTDKYSIEVNMIKIKKEFKGAYLVSTEKYSIRIESPSVNESHSYWFMAVEVKGTEFSGEFGHKDNWIMSGNTKRECIYALISFLESQNENV